MNEDNEHFEASDLSAVKQLLKSLDLKVTDNDENEDVSHQAFYNTFNRPDKEGNLTNQEKRTKTIQCIRDLRKDNQVIKAFWDAGNDSRSLQLTINGKDWEEVKPYVYEEVLYKEIIETLELPDVSEETSVGSGEITINPLGQVMLSYQSDEHYYISEGLSEENMWKSDDIPNRILTHRFTNNELSFASKFAPYRRGFQGEIRFNEEEEYNYVDFYFAPTLAIDEQEANEFANTLAAKVNQLAGVDFKSSTSTMQYFPSLVVNGQISDQKMAILDFKVTYYVIEKRKRTVALFAPKQAS